MNYTRDLPNEYLDLCPVIDQKYKVVLKLGFGRFSEVKMGINLATNQRVAIKIMNQKIDETEQERGYEENVLEMFLNEVKMSFEAKHRNIVQIIDFNVGGIYRTVDGKVSRILYYVMKIQQYGELFRIINQTEQFTERTARHIFKQLVSALRHIHSRRIAHGDIKSQNVLLDSKFNIKVVDFGYARYFKNEQSQAVTYDVSNAIGTGKCNAPELLNSKGKGEYLADSIDIFAAGCFLFQLLMKCEPFACADIKDEYYSKLTSIDKNKFWDIFSSKVNPTSEFKDLIQKMLNPNPKERISLSAVMKHPWLNGETMTKEEFRKEMNIRLKKVMVKIRKEQESEMKQRSMKEKGKKEVYHMKILPLSMKREFEEKIGELKNMLATTRDQCSSHSDASSLEDLQNQDIAKGEDHMKLSKLHEVKREKEQETRKE